MDYFKIKNWDKWQTYRKDRGQPPWIKLHRSLMRNVEWVSLTDSERGQLVAIWLLAADHDGVIPASEEVIKKICFMSGKLNLNKFIDLDFIESNGVNMASTRRQHDAPEVDKNRDREEKNRVFDSFWALYPKKKSKGQARKTWDKIKPSKELIEKIMSSLEKAKTSEDWTKDSGQFIPHPSTWLNAEGWEDENINSQERIADDEIRRFYSNHAKDDCLVQPEIIE